MQANTYFDDDDSFNIPVDEETEGHMKEFFKEVEEMRDLADKIDAKINEVKQLQSQILNSAKVNIWFLNIIIILVDFIIIIIIEIMLVIIIVIILTYNYLLKKYNPYFI